MATWMLPSELALPTRGRRGPCSPQEWVIRKGRQAGKGRGTHLSLTAPQTSCSSVSLLPPLLPSPCLGAPSHLLLTPKQHQPPIQQGEGPDVPDRHIRCGGLRDVWGRHLQLWLWLWVEKRVLGTWESFLLPRTTLFIRQGSPAFPS